MFNENAASEFSPPSRRLNDLAGPQAVRAGSPRVSNRPGLPLVRMQGNKEFGSETGS